MIGLTIRYDRIDNFWYCLMHELAHVRLHLDADKDDIFVHDHSLRGREVPHYNSKESEADDCAEEALIPKAAWDASEVSRNPLAWQYWPSLKNCGFTRRSSRVGCGTSSATTGYCRSSLAPGR